jgi:hypothetical protein
MHLSVQLEAAGTVPSTVDYRWDPDTEILSAHVRDRDQGDGMSGSVGVEGKDGSWLILDLKGCRIHAVEVAVWPELRHHSSLLPPGTVEDASVLVPSRRSQPNVASVETVTAVAADADAARRTIHFRFGRTRGIRTIRLACDILLDVDEQSRVAGVWLLNVPPCPAPS